MARVTMNVSKAGYPADVFPDTPIWDEPVRGSYPNPAFLGLPGKERWRYIPPPPIQHLFGLTPHRDPSGTPEFTMPASPWLQSPAGFFTAGTFALVADAPLGAVIHGVLEPGVFGTTSELSMSFLRPADVSSGTLLSRPRLIDAGRSVALSEAIVTDARGRTLAHTTSRYFLIHIDMPAPPADLRPPHAPNYSTPDPYERPLEGGFSPDALQKMSGLELFQAGLAGKLQQAPFARLLGIKVARADEGILESSIVASEWLQSPARTIYGGVTAFLADSVITGAVHTTVPAGSSLATLDLKVHYLRPARADGRELRARGEVVHRGRSIAVARAEILNAEEKQIAVATGSCMILHDRPWDPHRPLVAADERLPDDSNG